MQGKKVKQKIPIWLLQNRCTAPAGAITMRLTMKAFVMLMAGISVHAYGLQNIQVPHIELPQVQRS